MAGPVFPPACRGDARQRQAPPWSREASPPKPLAPGAGCSPGCHRPLPEPHSPGNKAGELQPRFAPLPCACGPSRHREVSASRYPGPRCPAGSPLRPSGPSRQPEVSASRCPRAGLSRFLGSLEPDDVQVLWPPDITTTGWQDGLGDFSQCQAILWNLGKASQEQKPLPGQPGLSLILRLPPKSSKSPLPETAPASQPGSATFIATCKNNVLVGDYSVAVLRTEHAVVRKMRFPVLCAAFK